jgi:excisionase family DNA binding protein
MPEKTVEVMSKPGTAPCQQLHMPQANSTDRLLTVPEVAELMGLAAGSVYHLISQKRIEVVRLSRRCVRVRLSTLLQWWDAMTDGQLARDTTSTKQKKEQ